VVSEDLVSGKEKDVEGVRVWGCPKIAGSKERLY